MLFDVHRLCYSPALSVTYSAAAAAVAALLSVTPFTIRNRENMGTKEIFHEFPSKRMYGLELLRLLLQEER